MDGIGDLFSTTFLYSVIPLLQFERLAQVNAASKNGMELIPPCPTEVKDASSVVVCLSVFTISKHYCHGFSTTGNHGFSGFTFSIMNIAIVGWCCGRLRDLRSRT